MTVLVHLSDLHFGRIEPGTLEPLADNVNAIKPNLVVISGDFTQRARSVQFSEAKEFLDKLPGPQLLVPGNHDIPLHNVWARFFEPLTKYKKYITADLHPFYQDANIAALGINTARSLTTKYGRINLQQIAEIRQRFCGLDSRLIKIVVTHHPFDLPEGANARDLVGRAQLALAPLSECGVDVLLGGHMHVGLIGRTAQRYKIAGYSAIFVQAGTATSTRGRGEPNSFNLLRIQYPEIEIEQRAWDPEQRRFMLRSVERFIKGTEGWERKGS